MMKFTFATVAQADAFMAVVELNRGVCVSDGVTVSVEPRNSQGYWIAREWLDAQSARISAA
jgi:hypothetical protein